MRNTAKQHRLSLSRRKPKISPDIETPQPTMLTHGYHVNHYVNFSQQLMARIACS